MGKRKYTNELKLKIVEEYRNGDLGLKLLAQKIFRLAWRYSKWSDAYREHGIDGLCKKYKAYDGQFKVDVIEYMHSTSSSARQTAAHFNISSHITSAIGIVYILRKAEDALLNHRQGREKRYEE